jgi:predicted RNA-binding Zn-ribbon protein involved in translation (DUF1610 family)
MLDGFREVFKSVRHRRPSQIFCPRCASPKIHLSTGLDLWLTPKSYVCDDCGYNGLIVMELEESSAQDDKEV